MRGRVLTGVGLWCAAQLYEAGEGVPQDMEQALKYWHLAAEQGEADAQNAVAETLIQQRLNEPAGTDSPIHNTCARTRTHAMHQICSVPSMHCASESQRCGGCD
eukprot:COSAG05_NODE_7328_length_826_cov_1.510316_2_plen_104_part_00